MHRLYTGTGKDNEKRGVYINLRGAERPTDRFVAGATEFRGKCTLVWDLILPWLGSLKETFPLFSPFSGRILDVNSRFSRAHGVRGSLGVFS